MAKEQLRKYLEERKAMFENYLKALKAFKAEKGDTRQRRKTGRAG